MSFGLAPTNRRSTLGVFAASLVVLAYLIAAPSALAGAANAGVPGASQTNPLAGIPWGTYTGPIDGVYPA